MRNGLTDPLRKKAELMGIKKEDFAMMPPKPSALPPWNTEENVSWLHAFFLVEFFETPCN